MENNKIVDRLNELEIKERLGQYQSLLYSGFANIDNIQRVGGSGYTELTILLTSTLAEFISEETKKELELIDPLIKKEQKELMEYLIYYHKRRNISEPRPENFKFWSNKTITSVYNREMSNFTASQVQVIKHMLLEDLQKAGLLLTIEKSNNKV